MKILQCVLFASLIIIVYQQEMNHENLISDPKDYPFFAMFVVKTPISPTQYHTAVCGATLINPQWVLTAGHCLPYTKDEIDELVRKPMNTIFMGSVYKPSKQYGQARKIISAHRHPDFAVEYDSNNQGYVTKIHNDLAALELNKPFQITPTVAVVHLSTTSFECKYGIILGIRTNWTKAANETAVLKYEKVTLQNYHPNNKNSAVFYTSDEVIDEYEPNGTRYTFWKGTGGPVLCDGMSNSIQIGVLSAGIVPSNNSNFTVNLVQRVDYFDKFITKATSRLYSTTSGCTKGACSLLKFGLGTVLLVYLFSVLDDYLVFYLYNILFCINLLYMICVV